MLDANGNGRRAVVLDLDRDGVRADVVRDREPGTPDPAPPATDNDANRDLRMLAKDLSDLLADAIEREASDVHLVPGYPTTFRVHGQLRAAGDVPLDPDHTRRMVASLLPERSRLTLDDGKNFDCSVAIKAAGGEARFRASIYLSQGVWCACLRHIPNTIPSFEWLGFSEELAQKLVSHKNGLVLFTGVTGSGKTASLAALVQLIRQDATRRILTVEEPIEYLHRPGAGGIVTQREVGRDVDSFADGLKHGLRQDPDVILVGEIRDRETAQIALSAAETGHLILATLHTRDAKGAITRLVDIFPQDAQDDIRSQLAMSLRSVVCQHLLPALGADEKRVLVMEVLHASQAVQVAIRAGKIEMLESSLQTGKREGMIPLDEDLQRLVKLGRISLDPARRYAKDANNIVATTNAWA
jgi:twitching motility protein PilT